MSERDLLLKELQESRRRTRAFEEGTRTAEEGIKAIEERARVTREEDERLFGPLTVKEYVEECHAIDGKLDVVTELTLVIEGPVVDRATDLARGL
ncbi:hypothetical protein E4U58_005853 [Claviceps cyperi]|nr:hypothetical protein E4U58_005853 [Claviceps cyperi]